MFPPHLNPAGFLSVQAVSPPMKGQDGEIWMGSLWDAAAPGQEGHAGLTRHCHLVARSRGVTGCREAGQRAAAACEGNSGLSHAN